MQILSVHVQNLFEGPVQPLPSIFCVKMSGECLGSQSLSNTLRIKQPNGLSETITHMKGDLEEEHGDKETEDARYCRLRWPHSRAQPLKNYSSFSGN
jgi:hypothetical protein